MVDTRYCQFLAFRSGQ